MTELKETGYRLEIGDLSSTKEILNREDRGNRTGNCNGGKYYRRRCC